MQIQSINSYNNNKKKNPKFCALKPPSKEVLTTIKNWPECSANPQIFRDLKKAIFEAAQDAKNFFHDIELYVEKGTDHVNVRVKAPGDDIGVNIPDNADIYTELKYNSAYSNDGEAGIYAAARGKDYPHRPTALKILLSHALDIVDGVESRLNELFKYVDVKGPIQ